MKDLPNSSFTIQIDEEGYFKQGDLRVSDTTYGRKLLESLHKNEVGALVSSSETREILVEAFDEPYVALQVYRDDLNKWSLLLPYDLKVPFSLTRLSLDEWDRFHGVTENGVPFVLSRAAQAEFFNLLKDFDDDSITDVDGKRYAIPPWLSPISDSEKPGFWNEKYSSAQKPPWDLEGPHPAIASILPQLKLPRCRILVLGCGPGHDAAALAAQGHIVVGVDFSETALAAAQEKYGHIPHLSFEKHDIFKLPENFHSAFDVVFEHTFYCAIEPKKRTDLVKVWRQTLTETGQLLGIFFVTDLTKPDRPSGPPFGGSEWELKRRLSKSFSFMYWTRWRNSPANRQGKELVVFAQRKDERN